MKMLVTGASGYIGRHLVKELSSKGYALRCLVRNTSETDFLPKNKCEKFVGDLTMPDTLKGICKGVDVVIHAAAVVNVKDNKREGHLFEEVNVTGTENLLKTCNQIKKFIHLSAVDAMGIDQLRKLTEKDECHPITPYGKTKHKSEALVKKYADKFGFKYTILRPAMTYGGGVSNTETVSINLAIFKFMKMIKKHVIPIFGSGKNKLPLVHVSNVVQATLSAIKKTKVDNNTYIISDERAYELNELVETISKGLNVKNPGVHIPIPLAKLGALGLEIIKSFTGVDLGISRSGIDYITANRELSIDKAIKDLDYKPINLEQGIKETIKWYKQNDYL